MAVFFRSFRVPLFLMLVQFQLSSLLLPAAEKGFSVRFTEKKALFSGQVDSEETAQALARAVKQARPDIEIVNKGVIVKSDMLMPDLDDLTSVLTEIGISTHEGTFSLNDESITISGLSDSLITSTALMIRLEPIKGNRRVISRICIVPTDDLPDIPVILADGKEVGPLLDFEAKQAAEYFFELPGVNPGKLVSLALFISKTPALGGSKTYSTSGTKPGRLRAMPVIVGGNSSEMTPSVTGTTAPKPKAGSLLAKLVSVSLDAPARPRPRYEELSPILFSRNTFLLQANQEAGIQENTKQLQSSRFSGKRLIIRAMKPQVGSSTFNDWLCQRRGEEVKKILSGRGIAADTMSNETVSSKKTGDTGEVRLIVVIPPPEPDPKPKPVSGLPAKPGTTAIIQDETVIQKKK